MKSNFPQSKRLGKWNPDGTCLYGANSKIDNNPNSSEIGKCLFDHWSIKHFYFTGLTQIILHHYLKLEKLDHVIYLTIFITLLHIIEEYLGNTSKFSAEGIIYDYIGPIFNKNLNIKDRTLDNDYLQNSLGDILSGLFASILIIIYWNKYKKLPYWYLYGIIPISIDLYYIIKE